MLPLDKALSADLRFWVVRQRCFVGQKDLKQTEYIYTYYFHSFIH